MNYSFLKKKYCFVFILLAFVILLIYSNSFDCSWQFDDHYNIVKNEKLHINNLYPQSIYQTFTASIDGGYFSSEKIYRPISMLSFALNWYLGQDNVLGYHVVNTIIHVLSSFCLFSVIIILFQTPKLKNEFNNEDIFLIAFLTSLIWAVHPINVQGVTYIVQRMASLAAMFYILSLFFYLIARLKESKSLKIIFFILSLVMFLLSIGSKENTALLPIMLVVIEIIFFDKINFFLKNQLILFILFIVLMSFFILLFYFFLEFKLPSFDNRSFTMQERIFTEARIIWYYLSQISYPLSSKFSIEHSIIISKGVFKPLSTFFSVITIISILTFSICFIRKYTLLAFSILFFFINHLVESSFIPLELIFEHRNYLPSMFFFLPLVSFFVKKRYLVKNYSYIIYFSLNLLISGFIFFIALATYTRNFDWKTDFSLWTDALNKAPNNSRCYQNLGYLYYTKAGKYFESIYMYKKALSLETNSPTRSKKNIYTNLSNIYEKIGDNKNALIYARKAYNLQADALVVYNYVITLLSSGQTKEARQVLNKFLLKKDIGILNLNSFVYLKEKKYNEAYYASLEAIKMEPERAMSLKMFAYSCFVLGMYEKADYYLNKALKYNSTDKMILSLCVIDNSIKLDSVEKKNFYIKKLISSFEDINFNSNSIDRIRKNYSFLNISFENVFNEITLYLEKKLLNIKELKKNED